MIILNTKKLLKGIDSFYITLLAPTDVNNKMDFTKKMALIKFAIAAGREDEIGTYLQIAGYLDKDFSMVDNVEVNELVDRTDCLILYTLKYRDALLKKWANLLEVDEVAYIKEAKKEFPFIKLLMTINRDIQFVNEKLLQKSKEELEKLEKDLIYKNSELQPKELQKNSSREAYFTL